MGKQLSLIFKAIFFNLILLNVHCKTHRKRSDIEMNETLNLHRQRTKWTADIELDNKNYIHGSIAMPVWVSIHSKNEVTLVNAAGIPISHPKPDPKLVIPICLYLPSSYRYSRGPPESPLQVDVPPFPEIQMFLLSMLMGKLRAQARLVMVSTVASLKTGEMPSLASVGFPQPLISMSRWSKVVFHSE